MRGSASHGAPVGAMRRNGCSAHAPIRRSGGDPGVAPPPVTGHELRPRRRGPTSRARRGGPGWRVEQRLHDPPLLLHGVLAGEANGLTDHRGVEQHLVRSRALRRPRRRTPCRGGSARAARVGVACLELERMPVDGSSLTTIWSGSASGAAQAEAEPRRVLEHEPQLGVGHRQALPGADEERDARPSPVLDVEPQRGVRLGGGVGGDAVDRRGSRRTGRARSARDRRSTTARNTAVCASFSVCGSPPAGASIAAARPPA